MGATTAFTSPMKNSLMVCSILALVSTASPTFAEEKKYTLADLKTLVAQKSYPEAVSHLQDIAPGDRNAEWLAVAADAATGYISAQEARAKIYAFEMFDQQFPALLKSPKYNKVRLEGVAGFETCLSGWGRQDCWERALKFVDVDPTNAELALKMAKMVRRNSSPAGAAAGFFKRALTAAGKNAGAVCKDEDMKRTVVTGFNFPDHYDDAKTIREMVTGTCWNEFKTVVLEEFKKAGETSYERRNTCEILKTQRALSADQTRACEKAKKDD